MVSIISGGYGKGKTVFMLERANSAVQNANGNIVYIDRNLKHMYELNNKIRLIDISRYPIRNTDQFIGFIAGILSQDHDIEKMFLDSFLRIAGIEDGSDTMYESLDQLEQISNAYDVELVISLSLSADLLNDKYKEKVVLAL